jgi:hypothetical protein
VLTEQNLTLFEPSPPRRRTDTATKPKKQSIGPGHRRMLNVLAKAPRGRDVNALLTRGFTFEMIADLVSGGLATVQLQRVGNGRKRVEVACVRITNAGQQAFDS